MLAHLAVVSLLINSVPSVLFALAETHATTVLAGIINGMTPLTSLFFIAVVFRDEPIRRHQVMGLVVGLVGIVLVLGAWRGFGRSPWWAVASLVLAVTLYGVSFPYTRRYLTPRGLDALGAVPVQLSFAALCLAPAFIVHGWHSAAPRPNQILSMLALGALGSGLAFLWNYRVIERAGAAVASTVTYLTPVVAVIVGVSILHEAVLWNQPLGGAVVLLGAAIAQGRLRLTRRGP